MHRELNTCFVHFMNVGRLYGLLNEKDIEPMAPLVELWAKQGVLPKITEKYEGTPNVAAPSSGGNAAAPISAGGAGSASSPA